VTAPPARVALVTGAARGQGAAIVARLARDGFRVAACDVLLDELAASTRALDPAAVVAIGLDVTSPAQWAAAVGEVADRFGTLTTLVNNAGVLHRASFADETPAGFEASWRVNCLGPFLGIQAALDQLRQADGAAIVNTCSTGAIRPFPNWSQLRRRSRPKRLRRPLRKSLKRPQPSRVKPRLPRRMRSTRNQRTRKRTR